jgi:microcystin-dependent protein
MTAGYIYHNGIIYPFDGINIIGVPVSAAYWYIQQQVLSPSPVTYQDGNTQNVHIRERFQIGFNLSPPPNSIQLGQIRRLKQIVGFTPQRGIIMYSGSVSDFFPNGFGKPGTPVDGWALCNGNTHSLVGGGTITTPDLRGRFIVGYDGRTSNPGNGIWDPVYNNISPTNVGGSKMHTLTINEMPAHTHGQGVRITGVASGVSGNGSDGARITGSNTNPTDSTGGGQPHENRPPFYVLAYIMKLY